MPPRKKPTPPPERWTVDITARDLADFLAPVIPHAAGIHDAPILNGIHFVTRGGYLIASATDRYTAAMHRRRVNGGDAPVVDGLRATVPLAAIRQILSVFRPARGEDPSLTLTFDAETLTVAASGYLSGFAVADASWRLAPGVYPRSGGIWPATEPEAGVSTVALNPTYLARLTHATRRGGPVQLYLRPPRTSGGPDSVIARVGDDFIALIQPARMTAEDQWLDDDWRDTFAAMAPETKTSGAA